MPSSDLLEIRFWQRHWSPHQADLFHALERTGRVRVVLITNTPLSADRAGMGWERKDNHGLVEKNAKRLTAADFSAHGVDIVSGFGGEMSGVYLRRSHGRAPLYCMSEVPEMITGLRGAARLLRARAFHLLVRRRLNGVLAIGAHSRNWFHRIGLPDDRILPWAYFVGANGDRSLIERHTEPLAGRTAVRFCYAGRLGASKGIIPLLLALGELAKRHPRVAISLDIVGDGPLGPEVREISARQGELRTRLHGALLRTETMRLISSADWLVLPSTGKEGWGAVISEALMEGTRVVCSDRCGAAVVAAASGCGIVYSSEVDANLFSAVERALRAGPWTEAQRTRLIAWAEQNIAPRRAADFLLRTIAEGPAKPREEVAWDPAVKHPDFYARSY